MRRAISSSLFLFLSCSFIFADSDQEKELFGYINSERSREHITSLVWDDRLYKVAAEHSKDMAAVRTVGHESSDGRQPYQRIRDAKIFASKTAENVACDINIISAHTSLMKSLYHRENILDPEFTNAAVAVAKRDGRLYVTELFIQTLPDYSLDDAREVILQHINRVRFNKGLTPVGLSKTLGNIAQSHVDVQTNLNSMTPLLIMGLINRQMKRAVLIDAYTTDRLDFAPEQATQDFERNNKEVGIGFREVDAALCESGCYLVVLIFGS